MWSDDFKEVLSFPSLKIALSGTEESLTPRAMSSTRPRPRLLIREHSTFETFACAVCMPIEYNTNGLCFYLFLFIFNTICLLSPRKSPSLQLFGQTIPAIHGTYLDTRVYTPGLFLSPQNAEPNDVMPYCV